MGGSMLDDDNERMLKNAIRYATDARLSRELRSRWFRCVRRLHAKRSDTYVESLEWFL